MTTPEPTTQTDGRDLILSCLIDAPPAKVYRAWTEPNLITQWFTPAPWQTAAAELDVRAGGSTLITMRGPDGTEIVNAGVFLEVVPDKKLVFTNAYTQAWQPSDKPFMTVILTFDDVQGKTRYTALVRHWTIADREAHEAMGFHQGWPIATRQLAALVQQA